MKSKKCTKCSETKSLQEFYKTIYYNTSDGYDYYCKYCRVGTALKSHRNKTKKCSVKKCGEVHYAKTYCRKHYARFTRTGTLEPLNNTVNDNKIYIVGGKKVKYKREHRLLTMYKITLDEFKSRTINGCNICGVKTERNLHVDHDHKCCNTENTCGNCVRGIVCNRCNTAIDKLDKGLLRLDYPMYNKIVDYVRVYNDKKRQASK